MSLGHENLWQYMENNRPLPPKLAVGVATQICNALIHVHERSIIHRDLKPANIVWNTEDDRENIFLIDFGIAKFVGEDVSGRPMDHFTSLKEFVGPSNFCSPELLAYARNKQHPVDHRSDLFQFGLLLWFLATNQVLAGVPSKKSDPTGGELHSLVLDLIAMEPDDRLPTANAVLERLKSIS